MFNNNHKNSDCEFAEQMVSYLYNESEGAEKSTFESHLKNCSACADEFAAFSGVHFSINDWKLKDFASLETPLIEIPYQKNDKLAETREVSSVKGSWLSGLRDLFSLSPRAWSLATASFAVLVVCFGIALFAWNSRNNSDLAGANKNKTKSIVAPTVEKTSEPSNLNTPSSNSPEKQPKTNNETLPSQPDVAVTNDTKPTNNRAVKVLSNSRQPQKVENNNAQKTPEVNNKNKNKTDQVAPRILTDSDEEDNTLRLAELFEEIDTK